MATKADTVRCFPELFSLTQRLILCQFDDAFGFALARLFAFIPKLPCVRVVPARSYVDTAHAVIDVRKRSFSTCLYGVWLEAK